MANEIPQLGKWGKDAINYILDKEKITNFDTNFFAKNFVADGTTSALAKTNLPNYDVVEIVPDRSKGKELYFLSGTPATLALQESLFIATYDAMQNVVGNNVDLKEWIAEFEYCFPSFSVRLAPYNQSFENPWGVTPNQRPQVRVLSQIKTNFMFYVCQFFPDRSNKGESYIISGDTNLCINQIMTLMNQWLMLADKSIGEWIGYPQEENLKRYPRTYATLCILFNTSQEGARGYRKQTKRNKYGNYKGNPDSQFYPFRQVQVTLPLVNLSSVSYNNLRKACGGENGMTIGYWTATREIGLGATVGFEKIVVRGDTFETAKKNIDNFLPLLSKSLIVKEAKPTYLTQMHEADSIDGYQGRLGSYKVYPYQAIFTSNTITSLSGSTGKKVRTGSKHAISRTVKISSPKAPPGWDTAIADIINHQTG